MLTRDGFERMYESVVNGVEDSADIIFDEMLAAGLLKNHTKDDDGTIVYSVIK